MMRALAIVALCAITGQTRRVQHKGDQEPSINRLAALLLDATPETAFTSPLARSARIGGFHRAPTVKSAVGGMGDGYANKAAVDDINFNGAAATIKMEGCLAAGCPVDSVESILEAITAQRDFELKDVDGPNHQFNPVISELEKLLAESKTFESSSQQYIEDFLKSKEGGELIPKAEACIKDGCKIDTTSSLLADLKAANEGKPDTPLITKLEDTFNKQLLVKTALAKNIRDLQSLVA
jgi:hypothetical protein